MAEMPELVQLHRAIERRGVRVAAVSIDLADPGEMSVAELADFVRERDFALPVVAFQGDWDALVEHMDLPGWLPCTLLIDRAGKEVGRIEGAASRDELEAAIAAALGR